MSILSRRKSQLAVAENEVRRLAWHLARMDPIKSPTKYEQMLGQLAIAREQLAEIKREGST